jgi:sec-independent protein translocase protein TatB
VFGFSLSELIVVIVVALVVIGPKDLPKMLRKLGQYAGKLRRMASDLRAQSGIDEALRSEGLADDIAEIRKLARGELDAVQRAAVDISGAPGAKPEVPSPSRDDFYVVRDREYPRDGADSYGALPDNAIVYADGLPKSKLARDPLYVLGDPNGILPEPEPPPVDLSQAETQDPPPVTERPVSEVH